MSAPHVAYLSGKMRGIPYWNRDAFIEAARELRSLGWTIHSPYENDLDRGLTPPADGHEITDPNVTLASQLAWDFARIAESDAVIVLPGWETSMGVHWEMTVAYALGKSVLQYPELEPIELPDIITKPVQVSGEYQSWHKEPQRFTARDGIDPDLQWPRVEYHTTQDLGPLGRNVEVRVIDPTTGGAKGSKLARFDLLPWEVLWEDAELYGAGSQKYEDRNWEKGYAWGLSIAALGRHLTQWLRGEDTDPETGISHLIAVRWHAGALRWFQLHGKGTDDRAA